MSLTRAVSVKTVDRAVGLLVVAVLGLGTYSWARAAFLVQEPSGMMGTMTRTDPIWYLFGSLVTASVVAGIYVFSRERIRREFAEPPAEADEGDHSQDTVTEASEPGGAVVSRGQPSALELLPEDERRVLEPILDSPGLTQVELRGRSDFSKAKVSQTVSDLEDRGLVYREKEGRTYRVYPGELLKGDSS